MEQRPARKHNQRCLMPVTRVPLRETSCFLSVVPRVSTICGSGIDITSQPWRSMSVVEDVGGIYSHVVKGLCTSNLNARLPSQATAIPYIRVFYPHNSGGRRRPRRVLWKQEPVHAPDTLHTASPLSPRARRPLFHARSLRRGFPRRTHGNSFLNPGREDLPRSPALLINID